MANVKYPECNGPFLVYDIPDMACVDGTVNECRGFYIVCPTDNRFTVMDDEVNWYSAEVASDGCSILFKVPAWPFGMYPKGKHSAFLYNSIVKQLGPNFQKSMNSVHAFFDVNESTDVAAVENRKWKHYLLDFSKVSGVSSLSAKRVDADAGEKEILDYDLIIVPAAWDETGKVVREEEYLGFRVGVGDTGRKTQRQNASKSKLAQKREQARSQMTG